VIFGKKIDTESPLFNG